MPDTPEIGIVQGLIERATLVTTLAWLVIGFVRGWVAPGSAVKAKELEIAEWRTRHDKLADIAHAALRKASGA